MTTPQPAGAIEFERDGIRMQVCLRYTIDGDARLARADDRDLAAAGFVPASAVQHAYDAGVDGYPCPAEPPQPPSAEAAMVERAAIVAYLCTQACHTGAYYGDLIKKGVHMAEPPPAAASPGRDVSDGYLDIIADYANQPAAAKARAANAETLLAQLTRDARLILGSGNFTFNPGTPLWQAQQRLLSAQPAEPAGDWATVAASCKPCSLAAAHLIENALSGSPATVEEGPLREALGAVAALREAWRTEQQACVATANDGRGRIEQLTTELRALRAERDALLEMASAVAELRGRCGRDYIGKRLDAAEMRLNALRASQPAEAPKVEQASEGERCDAHGAVGSFGKIVRCILHKGHADHHSDEPQPAEPPNSAPSLEGTASSPVATGDGGGDSPGEDEYVRCGCFRASDGAVCLKETDHDGPHVFEPAPPEPPAEQEDYIALAEKCLSVGMPVSAVHHVVRHLKQQRKEPSRGQGR